MGVLKNILHHLSVSSFLARKNLAYKKGLLVLIIMIVGLGYMSTIFSSSVINGLQLTLEDKAIDGWVGNVLIEPKDEEEFIQNTNEIVKKAQSLPEVTFVSPRIERGVTLIDDEGQKVAVQLRVVDARKESMATVIDDSILSGQYLSIHGTDGILIGAEFVEKYGRAKGLPTVDVDTGETVTAVLDNGVSKDLRVTGVYGVGFPATDVYAYINKQEAIETFNVPEEQLDFSSEIVVRTTERGDEEEVVEKLRSIGISHDITPWQEKVGIIGQFTGSLLIISNLTASVGALIAFATIYILVSINVLQRQSQIGMLQAVGISRSTILSSYLIQALIYGIGGILFGIVLNTLMGHYFQSSPILTPMGEVVPSVKFSNQIRAVVVLLISSLIAGYAASYRVIKKPILESIFGGY